MGDSMKHETVLKNESIEYLNIKEDGIYIDLTLGGGGHSEAILEHLTTGHLFGIDQDGFAIDYAKKRLSNYQNITYIQANFANVKEKLQTLNVTEVDGIMMDLGMSSFQIDHKERGFSYLQDAPLDMRMDQRAELTAKIIVNTYSVEQLTTIFREYGEEKNAYRIAKEIIKRRPLQTTFDLVRITDLINKNQKGHSAKRVFQALRIVVNNELDVLIQALEEGLSLLKVGGRMVCLTFHSLEDRIVKQFFKQKSDQDLPKGLPVIGKIMGEVAILTKKPIYPSQVEQKENSRSKSAKLRAIEKK